MKQMQAVPGQFIQHTPVAVDETSMAFWRRMAELVPGIIYVFNHETMSNEYSNCTIAEFIGYSPEDVSAMGDALLPTLVHQDDQPAMFAYLDSLRSLPVGAESTFEYRVTSKLGRQMWLRSVDTVFEVAQDGSVLRHIGIAIDITEQKTTEKRLTEANEHLEARVLARTRELLTLNDELEERVARRTAELREINRDLEDLTFVATHDLKVPVDNMTSLTHMLSEAEHTLPPEHAETLTWMRDVCQQASDKLEALISVAQANSGVFPPFERVDLDRIIERARVNLHFQIVEAEAVIELDLRTTSVWFMPRELEHMLQSLIGNAIRYHAPGRAPRITVRSRDSGGGVKVSVIDNGTGVDLSRDEAKVFGLFKRAHSVPEGAGVALYAIRRVLERAGGRITATSKIGQGSCFTVWLPGKPDVS